MEITDEQLEFLERTAAGHISLYRFAGGALATIFFSPELPELTGMSAGEYAECCRKDAADIVYAPDREYVRRAFAACASDRAPFTASYRIVRGGSGILWVRTNVRYCGEYGGDPVFLADFATVSSETDIFQDILDRSHSMIYISDRRTHEMLYANKPARACAGGLAYDGRKCHEYIRGEAEPCAWCFLDRVRPGELYAEDRYFPAADTWQHIAGEHITWCGRDAFVQYVDDLTPTKKLQQSLLESQRRYRLAVEGAEIGIWEYDIRGSSLFCPEIYRTRYHLPDRFFGVPDSVRHYCADESLPQFDKLFRQMDAGTPTVTGDLWLNMLPDTPPLCCRVIFSVLRGEDGAPVKAYGVSQNITAQKTESGKYQRALQELLSLNPNALCTFRLDLTANRCSDEHGTSVYVQKLLRGDTVDELFDHIAAVITEPEDVDKFRARFSREKLLDDFAAGASQVSLSYRRLVDSGESHWVATYANMLQNPDTGNIEAVVYSVDRNREKKEEEIISAVTDREYDYLALIDVRTRKISFQFTSGSGAGASAASGRDYDEVMRGALLEFSAPEERSEYLTALSFATVTARLSAAEEYNYLFRRRDGGGMRHKRLSYRYLNGMRQEILFSRTDVTDSFLQAQEQTERLRHALMEAEHASRMKTEFLSNVSHDMRTPLNAVLGYTNLALSSGDPAERADYLRKIDRAGNILLSLINDTLDLSKIENGAVILKPAPTDCSELIQKVVSSVRPSMDEKNIRFVFNNEAGADMRVNVDALRIQEIFINLLSNAVKFTPEGGQVTLTVSCAPREDGRVGGIIRIRDTGCGMSPSFLPKAFEPFAQERTPQTAEIGGSGLGLSIVKRLVELMGGSIEVRSQIGLGTEFTVRLDVERADDGGAAPGPRGEADLSGLRVLLCEDNAMNTEIARRLLEKRGVEVVCTPNGLDGFQTYASSPAGTFDAVLMDIRMPIMNGYEAAQKIRRAGRADSAGIPIVAMSADAYDDDVKRSAEVGMDGHIAKPIDPQRLYAELSRLCRAGNKQ